MNDFMVPFHRRVHFVSSRSIPHVEKELFSCLGDKWDFVKADTISLLLEPFRKLDRAVTL